MGAYTAVWGKRLLEFEDALAGLLKTTLWHHELPDSYSDALDDVLSRWSLGRDGEDLVKRSLHLEIGDTEHERLENSRIFAETIADHLGAEALRLLHQDILQILDGIESRNHGPARLVECVRDVWSNRMAPLSDITKPFEETGIFRPVSELTALGYLFSITIRVDGNVDQCEISTLRTNLRAWPSTDARLILAAVNLVDRSPSGVNILNTFDAITDENIHASVKGCAQFLRETSSTAMRTIMARQVVALIRADGVIHPSERWLWNMLRDVWDDVRV